MEIDKFVDHFELIAIYLKVYKKSQNAPLFLLFCVYYKLQLFNRFICPHKVCVFFALLFIEIICSPQSMMKMFQIDMNEMFVTRMKLYRVLDEVTCFVNVQNI